MAVTGIGGSAALTLQSIVDMRNQLDDLQRQLGTGKKSDTYAGLGLDRGLTVGPALATLRHRGLPADHQPGRRAARSDADRAVAVRQRRRSRAKSAILQSQYTLHGGTPDAGSDQRQRHARLPGRHAQHRRGRPLPVLRPHRRSGAGRDHRPYSQWRRPQGRAQADHRRAQAGRSRHQRPRPAGRRGADRDLGVARRGCGVAVRLQARRRDHDYRPAPR